MLSEEIKFGKLAAEIIKYCLVLCVAALLFYLVCPKYEVSVINVGENSSGFLIIRNNCITGEVVEYVRVFEGNKVIKTDLNNEAQSPE